MSDAPSPGSTRPLGSGAPGRAVLPEKPIGARLGRPMLVLASFALVFACLHLARFVLIPVAFAMLLALALAPAVTWVQRRGVHRVAAVLLVVALVFTALGVVGWVLAQQVTTLANDLPRYRDNIRQKIADIRLYGRGGSLEKVQETVKEVTSEIQKDDKGRVPAKAPVAVVPADSALPLTRVAHAVEIVATVGLMMVLVVFMLVERHEMRNRLIRLFGHGRISITTRALDEATSGIIRYLLMQSLVNGSFGVAVAIGLFFLGVPYPFLFGVLAALLRFIPYVGTWMAALLPIALSLAVFEGWTKPLLVIALFAILEPLIYAVVEPLLYGHTIGISQTALLVAVAFWTWLWGPVGLILATPLTVCMIVLGKYVPDLDFIVTLVTDRPALSPDVAYYQRLIAMDRAEAAEIIETELPRLGLPRLYDEVMLPALSYARRDHEREALSDEQLEFAVRTSREIVDEIVAPTSPLADSVRGRIVGCPGRDEVDEVALQMLATVLAPAGVVVEGVSSEHLTAEVVALVESTSPACICVAALSPGGLAQARYLVKRLHARFPDGCVVVGRWGAAQPAEDPGGLLTAGAARVGASLAATRDHVLELLPLTTTPSAPAEPVRRSA